MIACFDVDGTLITFQEEPKWKVINTLKSLKEIGLTIYVHSGGGKDYAEQWVKRLWLEPWVDECFCKGDVTDKIDISFDDEVVKFGLVNILV